jgi:hypothetical protein
MNQNDTIIVVGVTETDGYGNLWVTPQGGGDKVKIAKKRENLHSLFQQGKAVLLHWETYMNKTYVSDAKLVGGELPPPVKTNDRVNRGQYPDGEFDGRTESEPQESPLQRDEPPIEKYAPQEIGMWHKELGECIRSGSLERDFPNSHVKIKSHYYKKMSDVTGIPFQ